MIARWVFGVLIFPVSSLQASVVLSEGFNDVGGLTGSGWVVQNNSSPVGSNSWFQGNPANFPAHSGPDESYVAANLDSAAPGGNIDNWLMTPTLSIANGDILLFFTRTTFSDNPFPDRLEIRMSTNGSGTNASDFTVLLGVINPGLVIGGYPADWTLFSATVAGLSGSSSGRYALRYFVPDTNNNADYIGIDTLTVETGTAEIPEPSGLWLSVATGLAGIVWYKRRKTGYT